MKKDYTKLYDYKLLTKHCGCADRFIPIVIGKSGKSHNARPLPYYGFFYRIRDAWNVLWLKADALYWAIDEDN